MILAALLLAGCARQPPSPSGTFTRLETPAGWTRTEVRAYDQDSIFDLVDGQADSFFVYGFERVAVGRYQNAVGAILEASVWQLATPADAFGLFTASRSGEPVAIGNDGDGDPGRRLAFWQDRFVVQIWARQDLPDAEVQAFGKGLAAVLPTGGERPAILARLPEELRRERSLIYFHQQLSIDSDLWLGGENLLGLSPQTNGILARLPGDGGRAHLLLVEYPDEKAAEVARGALETAGVEGLVACQAQGRLVAAAIGDVDSATATRWLQRVLTGAQD